MTYIYTVTALEKDGLHGRCFGFFFNETDARVTAFNNHCDLQECLYQYLVIEKQFDGIHALAEVIQWYFWSNLTEHWEECSEPNKERFNGIINWSGIG
jgi:hypothetical protein